MKSITIQNVTKRYGLGSKAFQALTDVCLEIPEGEFFFLLGPSGCGKTTLLRAIAGLHDITEGKLFFGDEDVTDQAVDQRNTAMVFQNYALWPHMTIYQNVEFGPKMQHVSAGERRRLADENLDLVQLIGLGGRKPNQLSGGQQQRVALARALAARADCLLLDEPLSNLDARLRMQMRTELRRLVKDSGATAIYVTHDQKEALSMADRIAVMRDGRIIQVGPPEEVYNRPNCKFVADFIGEANFLDGLVKQVGETITVETTAGVMQARRPEGPEPALNDPTCVCVRPEWVAMAPPDAPLPNTSPLPATISQEVYLGELRQYFCTLDDGTQWRISTLGEQVAPFSAGQQVSLCIAPADVCLLSQ